MFSNNFFPDMPYCVVKKVISALKKKSSSNTAKSMSVYFLYSERLLPSTAARALSLKQQKYAIVTEGV